MDTQGEFELDRKRKPPGPGLCCQSCLMARTTAHGVAYLPDQHHTTMTADNRPVWIRWTVISLLLLLHTIPGTYAGLPASVTGFYTDNTAQQTILLDENISAKQKRVIRNEILHLLGLEHKPKIKTRGVINSNSAPLYMLELYRTLGDDGSGYTGSGSGHYGQRPHNLTLPGLEDKLEKADLIMSFVNQAGLQNLNSDGGRRFYFDFSGVKSTESVTGAELRVYKYTTPWLFDRGPFTLKLFKINSDQYKERSVLVQATTLPVHALAEGWLNVEATAVLRHWILEPEEQVLMYLEVTDKYGVDIEPSTIGLVDSSGPRDKQAFLVTCFKATHKLHARKSRAIQQTDRVKRSPAPSNYYSDEKDYGWKMPPDRPNRRACQRRQLYVSFKALGWETWVIAPEGYPAYYCQGECMFPLNAHMNATNHAIVQALVNLVKPFLAPNPSCAPTTLNGISFLYLDNSYNVVLKQYKNMVVQACGCH